MHYLDQRYDTHGNGNDESTNATNIQHAIGKAEDENSILMNLQIPSFLGDYIGPF